MPRRPPRCAKSSRSDHWLRSPPAPRRPRCSRCWHPRATEHRAGPGRIEQQRLGDRRGHEHVGGEARGEVADLVGVEGAHAARGVRHEACCCTTRRQGQGATRLGTALPAGLDSTQTLFIWNLRQHSPIALTVRQCSRCDTPRQTCCAEPECWPRQHCQQHPPPQRSRDGPLCSGPVGVS